MAAIDRYSALPDDCTLDDLIEVLTEARRHGAPGEAIVKAWDPESDQVETITGFVISKEDNTIRFYTDEP